MFWAASTSRDKTAPASHDQPVSIKKRSAVSGALRFSLYCTVNLNVVDPVTGTAPPVVPVTVTL